VKIVSFLVFLVLSSMILEDCLYGHAAAEDVSTPALMHFLAEDHQHSPASGACESTNTRSASHFGHCSFLLIDPSFSSEVATPTAPVVSKYFFSLKLGQQTSLLRPPISGSLT
jgi:hypothetical protein